jgi:hypothetical protein
MNIKPVRCASRLLLVAVAGLRPGLAFANLVVNPSLDDMTTGWTFQAMGLSADTNFAHTGTWAASTGV